MTSCSPTASFFSESDCSASSSVRSSPAASREDLPDQASSPSVLNLGDLALEEDASRSLAGGGLPGNRPHPTSSLFSSSQYLRPPRSGSSASASSSNSMPMGISASSPAPVATTSSSSASSNHSLRQSNLPPSLPPSLRRIPSSSKPTRKVPTSQIPSLESHPELVGLPLLPFLVSHPNPSFILPIPDPEKPTSTYTLNPIWCNSAAFLPRAQTSRKRSVASDTTATTAANGSTPNRGGRRRSKDAAAAAVGRGEDANEEDGGHLGQWSPQEDEEDEEDEEDDPPTMLDQLDEYSAATVRALILRLAGKLAEDPVSRSDTESEQSNSSESNKRRRAYRLQHAAAANNSGSNEQDIIYCRLTNEGFEEPFHATLIPMSPSLSGRGSGAASPSPPTFGASNSRGGKSSLASGPALLVLQFFPLNHHPSSTKYRRVVESNVLSIPSMNSWGAFADELEADQEERKPRSRPNPPPAGSSVSPTSTNNDNGTYNAEALAAAIKAGVKVKDFDSSNHDSQRSNDPSSKPQSATGGPSSLHVVVNKADGSGDGVASPELDKDVDEATLAELQMARPSSTFSTKSLLKSFDWASTSVGPRDKWSPSLKSAVSIMQHTGHESALFWGDDYTLIYNDAYAAMSMRKHPWLYGKPASIGWGELWPNLHKLCAAVHRGQTVHRTDDLLFFQRDVTNMPEETYHTWSFVPVEIEDGSIGGILNSSFETTSTVLAQRRLKVLRNLAQGTANAKTRPDFYNAVLTALESNHHDVPFAILYDTSEVSSVPLSGPTSSSTSRPGTAKTTTNLNLAGSLGAPANHPSLPTSFVITIETQTPRPTTPMSTSSAPRSHLVYATRATPGETMPIRPGEGSSASAHSTDGGVEGGGAGGGSAGSSSSYREPPLSIPAVVSVSDSSQSSNTAGGSGSRTGNRSSSMSTGTSTSADSTSTVTVLSAEDDEPCPWPIAEAISARRPVFVEDCRSLVEGFESRSWGELPESALIIPITDTDDPSSTRQAILIVGLNTRRPFDKEYQSWLRLVRLQLSSGLTGVIALEAQILRAEELAQLDRAKTAFFSNVSHELRTPLTLISGPIADLISREAQDGPRKRLLTLAARNIRRLARLVDMLMDVSRVEAGRMQGTFSPKQLGHFTMDLASLFRSAVEQGGINYEVDCDIMDERRAYVDGDLWEKIVFNLIGNAFKYTLVGSICVYLRYYRTFVEFGVQDTGVGIPREDIPKVVERFHRVSSIGRSHEGTGIGLSLTVELIKLHGGTLEVQSCTAEESPNGQHGSNFIVRIPLGKTHLPKDRIDERSTVAQSGPRAYSSGIIDGTQSWQGSEDTSGSDTVSESGASTDQSGSSGGKIDPSTLFWSKKDLILVVDDNSDMRKYISAILSPFVRVVEAGDGMQALEQAEAHRPDLIISDVMMPVLDGYGFITALRALNSDLSLIPVILLTARAGEDENVKGLLHGAEDHISKPFNSRELIAHAHMQMEMGKRRLLLERGFRERTLELQARMEEAEVKRLEAEEQKRQQELLIDVTSHELRNPVSAILQCSGLCKENMTMLVEELRAALESDTPFKPTPALINILEEDIDAVDSITAMARSQETIANDILSLARIQLSTLEIFPVDCDLVKETHRIISIFSNECRMKRISLLLDIGPSLQQLSDMGQGIFKIDSVRLSQVFVNLLSNAIRFTAPAPRREIAVTVEVRKDPPLDDSCLPPPSAERNTEDRDEDETVYLYGSVKDSGPGLSPEELSQLFQRFKQASPQTHAVFGGSGLGLYVCRQICQLMGGRVEVASVQGQGSTFRFFVKSALPKKDYLQPSDASAVSPSNGTIPTESMHVLVVEDNLINQKVLKRQLVKAGMTCDLADNGQIALDLIRAAAPKDTPEEKYYKCILMDLEMPVMDGLTAIKAVRAMEASGELSIRSRVFALTGNARQGQIDYALQCGMDDVILKPYKIDSLLAKMRDAETPACSDGLESATGGVSSSALQRSNAD